MLTSIYFPNLPIIIKASEQHPFLNVCKWKKFSWTKLWKWRKENPLGKQEPTLTWNILPKKKEHFCECKLLEEVFSWWLKTHPNQNHAVSQKRELYKVHLILEEMGQLYLLVLKDNFAAAPWTQCCLQELLLLCHFGYPSWHPTRPWPRTSIPKVRFASWKGPIQEATSVLLLTNHHSSFTNQKHISKTVHPPDITCCKIHKKTGKDSLRYSILHML